MCFFLLAFAVLRREDCDLNLIQPWPNPIIVAKFETFRPRSFGNL